jgi:hypothetical protein
MVYDELEWVAWMHDKTKSARVYWIKDLNFGGTTDWAVDLDGDGGLVQYRSPISTTIISLPAKTVKPSATFTIGGAVTRDIRKLLNDGNQNFPRGPGAKDCGVSCSHHL